jgi:hypothetical protein
MGLRNYTIKPKGVGELAPGNWTIVLKNKEGGVIRKQQLSVPAIDAF